MTRALPPPRSSCSRCSAAIDPERLGEICDDCIAADRLASRRIIDKMHPANRLRLMTGLPLLPEEPHVQP